MKTRAILVWGAVLAAGATLSAACASTPPSLEELTTRTTTTSTTPTTAATTTTRATTAPSMPPGAPCGWRTGAPPAQWDHVVMVVFENKSVAQIFDPASTATFIKSLPSSCGYAADYWAVWIRSLANYLALTSGDTHGQEQLADPPPREAPAEGDSIFQQLGDDWTVLAESMQTNCQMTGDSLYNPRHVPSLYYTAIRSACATRTIPLGATPDLSKRFTMIIPNMVNDMHLTDLTPDIPSRIKAGDDWLRDFLPKLLATPEYQAGRTAIIITWDEGQATNSQVPLFVISPYVKPGTRETRNFTHYSLLRTMQEMMGLTPLLGRAATAPSMRGGPLEL